MFTLVLTCFLPYIHVSFELIVSIRVLTYHILVLINYSMHRVSLYKDRLLIEDSFHLFVIDLEILRVIVLVLLMYALFHVVDWLYHVTITRQRERGITHRIYTYMRECYLSIEFFLIALFHTQSTFQCINLFT